MTDYTKTRTAQEQLDRFVHGEAAMGDEFGYDLRKHARFVVVSLTDKEMVSNFVGCESDVFLGERVAFRL